MTEFQQLDTLYVSAPAVTEEERMTPPPMYELPVYNGSTTQTNDLLHTHLELSFNWETEQVIGTATLRLHPYFYSVDEVLLDAKGFDFQEITMDDTPLEFDYDGQVVLIQLPRMYTREEEYELHIEYVATPAESGGSEAITSDQGLFFINPRGEEPGKPQQIWTQGETEHNSRWFPTIDKPNERCTQEMVLTVQDRFATLSNGLLVSSTDNGDGTRTDYWKMDKPHAPYLFMLAIGEYSVVEDEAWNDVPVNYYVEAEYEAYAKDIFPYTPEMLTFFSDLTGVPYPWQKYSQVVVRDYVSGAMENTTGVIFGEFMYGTDRELIDELNNERIVAHELMHHWFGDLVTCENWANLTLNEGFANYGEYLWFEHQHGRDEADYHLLQEWNGYLGSAMGGNVHPLIHYGYDDKEDMFDAHSYNKGGAVLHMLRYYLGDDAFFAAWNRYLEDNAFSAVEVDELRLAFEDVSGRDLQWFFNQWFLDQGHPDLNISYDYDAASGEAIVEVVQQQDPEEMPAIFQLPVAVDIYLEGQEEPTRHLVMVDEREQSLRFAVPEEPALVIFDAERVVLGITEDEKTDDQLVYQFYNAPRLFDRFEALEALKRSAHPESAGLLEAALSDPFYAIRGKALQSINLDKLNDDMRSRIREIALNDPHSGVRAEAIYFLETFSDDEAERLAKEALSAEPYNVVAAGLEVLSAVNPEECVQAVDVLTDETNSQIVLAIGQIYAIHGDEGALPYFEDHMDDVDGYEALDFFGSYQSLLIDGNSNQVNAGIERLQAVATNMGQSPWRRIGATKSLSDLRQAFLEKSREQNDAAAREKLDAQAGKLRLIIDEIREQETDDQLRSIYQQF